MTKDEFDAFERWITIELEMYRAEHTKEPDREPPKRTFGELTVREVWETCHAHEHCKDCPFGNDLCVAFLWQRPEGILNTEVDL